MGNCIRCDEQRLASLSDFFLLRGMGVLVMNDTPEETNLNLVFIILLLPTIILVSVTDSVSGGELLKCSGTGLLGFLFFEAITIWNQRKDNY